MKQTIITSAIIPGTVSNYDKLKRKRSKARVSFSTLESPNGGGWGEVTARAPVFSASKFLYLLH